MVNYLVNILRRDKMKYFNNFNIACDLSASIKKGDMTLLSFYSDVEEDSMCYL